ncbi:MAG: ribonuclease Z [Saprospiraceae bacterium]|nr:ribonuclease Z [Saprospiraceae bacterium]
MKFELLVLGTNAAIPTNGGITSAQLLNINENLFLLDCGEGTQLKLDFYKIKRNKITAIFISHLHGDHFFGLPGLLTSFGHFHRNKELQIFGPKGLKKFIDTTLATCQAHLGYELIISEVDTEKYQMIYENKDVVVFTIPLKHRIPTTGFLFREKKGPGNIRKEIIEKYQPSIQQILEIKDGKDLNLQDGNILLNKEIIAQQRPTRSYAYCTDTIYTEDIIPLIKGVDMLYHETTYLDDLQAEATERMHSTISDAARIANAAGVGKLLTGHYSSRYKNAEKFKDYGSKLFINTCVSREGDIHKL